MHSSGSGNGPGNPFGVAAVMAVLLVPTMFWRLFTPSLIPAIMYGVCSWLIVEFKGDLGLLVIFR